MIDPQEFIQYLQANAVEFFTGVPDSLLKDLCSCLERLPRVDQHIIAANEGGAIALALGYHLAPVPRASVVYGGPLAGY